MTEYKKYTVVHKNFKFEVDKFLPKEEVEKNKKKRFNRFLSICKDTAEMSNFNSMRIGAIITLKRRIVSKGVNSYKGHPLQKIYNENRKIDRFKESTQHAIHAELNALNKIKHIDLKGAEIFVYHINDNGEPKIARPCEGCIKAILDRGISIIHYTTNNGIATENIETLNNNELKKSKINKI